MVYSPFGQSFSMYVNNFNIFNTLFTFLQQKYMIYLHIVRQGGVSINCRASVRNCRRQVLQML